ncbi:UEV domain-containing protein [Gaertneriomyces semiglobifer]|nr:UEV domain-containing protein [Gaertneriomyces semiglobifer]
MSTQPSHYAPSEHMLSLHGTLPITYKSKPYNIPLQLWIPKNYPEQPPMVYVTPTLNMGIRVGKHVDEKGRVYHPYLAYWHVNVEDSTMIQFLRLLQDVFTMEPPVFAKQTSTPHPQQSGYGNMSTSGPQQQLPQQGTSYLSQSPASSYVPRHGSPPIQMPMPGSINANTPPNANPNLNMSLNANSDHGRSSPLRGSSTPLPAIQHNSQNYNMQYGGQPTNQNQAYSQQQGPPQSQPQSYTAPPPLPNKPLLQTLSQIDYTSRLQTNTLRTTLKDRLSQLFATSKQNATSEIDTLLAAHARLSTGSSNIQARMAQLRSELAEKNEQLARTKTDCESLQKALDELRSCQVVDVDKIVMPLPGAEAQFYQTVIVDHALDDTLYELSRALTKGVVKWEVVGRAIREASKEQFLCRALGSKIKGSA